MPDETLYLKFLGLVNDASARATMSAVEKGLQEGVRRIVLLMSSSGGNVFAGITLYNFLRGVPADLVTHNIGSTNSIAAAVFCAGRRRLSVPHGVFLIHGVMANFPQGAQLEEKQLEERLKGVRIDTENIAGIIAANTRRTEKQVLRDMYNRTTLSPEQAMKYGLVHEIEERLFPEGARLISIEA